MCAGVGIADTGGLAGSASDFAVPANTGEMAAYFAIQKRPPGAASSSLSQQQQQSDRHLRGESAGLASSSLSQQQQQQQGDRHLRGVP